MNKYANLGCLTMVGLVFFALIGFYGYVIFIHGF